MTLAKKNAFYKLTRERLEERLAQVKAGKTPENRDARNFFYVLRNEYIQMTGDTTLDYGGEKSANTYRDWSLTCYDWYAIHAHRLGFTKNTWWRLRDALNIFAAPKAMCMTPHDKFMIDYESRGNVSKGCSFILVSEKLTVRDKLKEALEREGYTFNLVSSGGMSTGDFKEVAYDVAEVMKTLDNDTFYILVLHDYDLAGVQIIADLRKLNPRIIDVGITTEFLDFLEKKHSMYRLDIIEEDVVGKKEMSNVKDYMDVSPDYDPTDYNYLQGTQVAPRKWNAKRIEIDAIEVRHGIQPFVDYILKKIEEECNYWDLRRIGVRDFDLEEPTNHYHDTLQQFDEEARQVYADKHEEQEAPKDKIRRIVNDTLKPIEDDTRELLEDYWENTSSLQWSTILERPQYWRNMKLKTDEVDDLKEDYKTQREKKWVPDYEDKLDDINKQIECYEGDVREGESDLEEQRDELQSTMEEDMEKDPEIEPFKEKVLKVDYGKEKVKQKIVRDKKELTRKVIAALQESLKNR